jgi:lipoic acid synthetase/lipoate-protein ligase A
MDHMLNAITPSQEKLQSKGIKSVRQRITFLKDHTSLSLNEINSIVRTTLREGELILSQADIEGIEQLEQTYLRKEFINRIQ